MELDMGNANLRNCRLGMVFLAFFLHPGEHLFGIFPGSLDRTGTKHVEIEFSFIEREWNKER